MKITKTKLKQIIKEEILRSLKEQEEREGQFQTVGQLRKAVSGAVRAKRAGKGVEAVKDVSVGVLIDMIPGAATAKSLWDIAKSMYSLPDDKKTNTGLDFLNVDDEVSAIVDDTIENDFLKTLAGRLKALPDETPLQQINMTNLLAKFIADKFSQRTVTGHEEG